jgi:hypothetical protein
VTLDGSGVEVDEVTEGGAEVVESDMPEEDGVDVIEQAV